MSNNIVNLFKSEHGITALYLALIAGALANFIPDPTDGLNFYLDRKWRIELEKGELTPTAYYERKVSLYYGLDSVWWLFVLLIVWIFGKDLRQKTYILGGLVGAGVVVAVIFNNIKEDQKFFDQYQLVKKV